MLGTTDRCSSAAVELLERPDRGSGGVVGHPVEHPGDLAPACVPDSTDVLPSGVGQGHVHGAAVVSRAIPGDQAQVSQARAVSARVRLVDRELVGDLGDRQPSP
jgi:hypothetical protein